MDEPNLFIMLW